MLISISFMCMCLSPRRWLESLLPVWSRLGSRCSSQSTKQGSFESSSLLSMNSSCFFSILKKYQGSHCRGTQDPYLGLNHLHLLKGGIKGWRWYGLHLVHKSQVIRAAMSFSSTNMGPSSLPDIWIFCLYLKTGISPNHDHVGTNFAELPLLWASSRAQ